MGRPNHLHSLIRHAQPIAKSTLPATLPEQRAMWRARNSDTKNRGTDSVFGRCRNTAAPIIRRPAGFARNRRGQARPVGTRRAASAGSCRWFGRRRGRGWGGGRWTRFRCRGAAGRRLPPSGGSRLPVPSARRKLRHTNAGAGRTQGSPPCGRAFRPRSPLLKWLCESSFFVTLRSVDVLDKLRQPSGK